MTWTHTKNMFKRGDWQRIHAEGFPCKNRENSLEVTGTTQLCMGESYLGWVKMPSILIGMAITQVHTCSKKTSNWTHQIYISLCQIISIITSETFKGKEELGKGSAEVEGTGEKSWVNMIKSVYMYKIVKPVVMY